jgi:riboflavin synthase
MFTGIIEEVGRLAALEARGAGARLRVEARLVTGDLREGDSVAVNGVCLTAVDLRAGGFGADVSPETLRRSTLGALRAGDALNLERAMTPSSRFGGHIVLGHVDGVGEIAEIERLGDENWRLAVRAPEELDPYLVFKGSVALEGISLTIAELEKGRIEVAVIPHTWQATTLSRRRVGDRVNIETDILAKHVEKLLGRIERPAGLTEEKLRALGF